MTSAKARGTKVDPTPDTVPGEAVGTPAYLVNITASNPFRYSIKGEFGRRMYERRRTETGDYHWQARADLPYVHARVAQRDGTRRRVGTAYLISLEEHGPREIVTDDDLADGTWAKKIGANLSGDHTIVTAAGTTIRDMAHRWADEREATPRPDVYSATGHIDLPVAECLPDGYLRMPPRIDDDAARVTLVRIAEAVTRHPKMALTMGASAGAAFVGPLRRQPHWWDLYGDARNGKSTALAVAAMVWGDPRIGDGILLGWDVSRIGLGRHLGQLGILPPFLDERGLSSFNREQWGELIYSSCQGSSRLVAEVKGTGTRKSAPWFGVLFSTGNARLTDGIAAGRFAGVPARVIELATPFTTDADEADWLAKDMTAQCYGWLGSQILATVTVDKARELVKGAQAIVGMPAGGVPRTIAEHLHMAVAGAMMVDAILGTGSMVTDAAAEAAREHLAERGHDPEHDADRMLAYLDEAIVSTRPDWPTMAEYLALDQARPEWVGGVPDRSVQPLPQHGFSQRSAGIRTDEWLYVFPATWAAMCETLGVDSSLALSELHRRGVLHVPTSTRKRGEWKSQPRIDGKKHSGLYQLRADAIGATDDDDQGDAVEPGPTAGPVDVPEQRTGEPAAVELVDAAPATVAAVTGCTPCASPGGWCGLRKTWPAPIACGLCGADSVTESLCGQFRCPACSGSTPADNSSHAGPRPATRRRDQVRADRLAADIAGIAEGTAPKILQALESTHSVWRKVDGTMRAMTRSPELPAAAHIAHVVTGWNWSREWAGPTVVLDRSGAWVAAASSVQVAHGPLTDTGETEFTGRPGYYLVQVHPWHEGDSLPHPLAGVAVGKQVWVPAPTVSRLVELAEQGRWADATILDSRTADGVRLDIWTRYVNALREHTITTYGRDSKEYDQVKTAFGQAMSLMLGSANPGQGRKWKCATHRTDITHTIQAQASATLHRWADDVLAVAPEFGPVAVRNVDELVIPAQALEIVTSTPRPGGRSPLAIDPDGIRLGTFKVKGTEVSGS